MSTGIAIGCGAFFMGGIVSITVLTAILALNLNEELCDPEQNADPPVEIKVFFLYCFVVLNILNTASLFNLGECALCKYCGISLEKRTYYSRLGNGVYMFAMGLVALVFCILGFIIYSESTEQCKGTAMGKDILAFCILCTVYCPCFCCVGVLSVVSAKQAEPKATDELKEQLNPTADKL